MIDCLPTKKVDNELDTMEKSLHKWGCSASEALLDAQAEIFKMPNIEGFIGYRLESSCAIVFGVPICPLENRIALAQAFQKYCEENHLNTIYIIAPKDFAEWAIKNVCKIMIEMGEELIFNPQNYNDINHGKVRQKVTHVLHMGLKVHEYLPHDETVENSIQQVGYAWLKARKGPQISLGPLDFFKSRFDKRWFYVKQGDRIIGASLLSKLDAKQGWLLKYIITVPEAPRGTSELLMMSMLETLSKENCHYLTYGIVPAKYLREIVGLGHFSTWLARSLFSAIKWIFNLNNRKLYWEKFRPITEPSYVLFSNPSLNLHDIRALIKSLKI